MTQQFALEEVHALLLILVHLVLQDSEETNASIQPVLESHPTFQMSAQAREHVTRQILAHVQLDMVELIVNMQFATPFLQAIQLFVQLVVLALLQILALVSVPSLEQIVSYYHVQVETFQMLMSAQLETMIFTIYSSCCS